MGWVVHDLHIKYGGEPAKALRANAEFVDGLVDGDP